MSENENGPPPGAGAADAIRQYMEAKTEKDARLVDVLHRALAARFDVKPNNKEGE